MSWYTSPPHPYAIDTTAHLKNSEGIFFKIIHPFNPMYQKVYKLIERKMAWNEDRVFFVDEKGDYRSIPASWTNICDVDPFVKISSGKSYFKFNDLLLLRKLLNQIRQKDLWHMSVLTKLCLCVNCIMPKFKISDPVMVFKNFKMHWYKQVL